MKEANPDEMITQLFNRMSESQQEKMTDFMALMNILREHNHTDKNPVINAYVNNIGEWV